MGRNEQIRFIKDAEGHSFNMGKMLKGIFFSHYRDKDAEGHTFVSNMGIPFGHSFVLFIKA